MANSVSISTISGENVQYEGSYATRIVTLTLVSDGSSYADGGIAFAAPTTWHQAAQINNLKYVVHMDPVLATSDFELALPYKVDTTNGKVVVFAPGSTAAEKPLSEFPASALDAGTYTGLIKIIGF